MSLILDKINYVYSEGTAYQIQALKDVNLEIKDGQFIGVIGGTSSLCSFNVPTCEKISRGVPCMTTCPLSMT